MMIPIKILDCDKKLHDHEAFFKRNVWHAHRRVWFNWRGVMHEERDRDETFIYSVSHDNGYCVADFERRIDAARFAAWMANYLPDFDLANPCEFSKDEIRNAVTRFHGDKYWVQYENEKIQLAKV